MRGKDYDDEDLIEFSVTVKIPKGMVVTDWVLGLAGNDLEADDRGGRNVFRWEGSTSACVGIVRVLDKRLLEEYDP